MATPADVERSIRVLAKKLADASPDPKQVPNRTIVCVLTDLDTAYRVELQNGRLQKLKQVTPDAEAQVRIAGRSDDLVALMEGKLNVATAFLLGRVRVDAPASDLLLLRKIF